MTRFACNTLFGIVWVCQGGIIFRFYALAFFESQVGVLSGCVLLKHYARIREASKRQSWVL